jgi:outer membrane protein assembly factor BamB
MQAIAIRLSCNSATIVKERAAAWPRSILLRSLPFVAAALLSSLAVAARADDWPQWRGPTGMGLTAESKLPLKWDGKSGTGIAWKASLAGTTGHSCPIVWQDRVFVTLANHQTREQEGRKEIPDHFLACFEARTGKQLWRTRIPPGREVAGYSIYASPTPVTDGKVVYCWFGSAVLAAVDFDGKLLWRQERTGPFFLNPGICASPVLYNDTLILLFDQSHDKGLLQGLNKANGEPKWEQKRQGFDTCNTTPLFVEVHGRKQLVAAGSKALEAHDPTTGELLWTCQSWGFGSSPVYGRGLIYADRGGNEPAVSVDPTGKGDVSKTHLKWKIDKMPGDYSSPVVSGEYLYRVVGEGVIDCRRMETGEKLYTGRLEGVSKLASPVATADGLVYFVSTGKSYVIKAGPTLEILATNDLGGFGNGSSPAVANGHIFTRDFDYLYCLGTK